MGLIFYIFSIFPYILGVIAYHGISFLHYSQFRSPDVPGYIVFAVFFWFVSTIMLFGQWTETDEEYIPVLILISSIINGYELLGYAGAWAYSQIMTEHGFDKIVFLKIVGPPVLLVVFLILDEIDARIHKDDKDHESSVITRACCTLGLIMETLLVMCIFQTTPQSIKIGGHSTIVVPFFMGYDIQQGFAPGLSAPTWSNFPEWTRRLKAVAIIMLIMFALALLGDLIIMVRKRQFIKYFLPKIVGIVVFTYILYAFLLVRRNVLMQYFLWENFAETAMAVLQFFLMCPLFWFFGDGSPTVPEKEPGEKAPEEKVPAKKEAREKKLEALEAMTMAIRGRYGEDAIHKGTKK